MFLFLGRNFGPIMGSWSFAFWSDAFPHFDAIFGANWTNDDHLSFHLCSFWNSLRRTNWMVDFDSHFAGRYWYLKKVNLCKLPHKIFVEYTKRIKLPFDSFQILPYLMLGLQKISEPKGLWRSQFTNVILRKFP